MKLLKRNKILKFLLDSVVNPVEEKRKQTIVGVMMILFLGMVSIVTNNAVAQKNTGYGYGYSSNTYGYGYQYSDYLPSAPTSLSCSTVNATSFSCTWTAPTTTTGSTTLDNLSSYKLYYSTTSGNATSSAGTLGGTATSASATVTGLSCGNTYYAAIYAYDDNSNVSSVSSEATVSTSACGGGSPSAGVAAATTTTTTTTTVTTPTAVVTVPTTTITTPSGVVVIVPTAAIPVRGLTVDGKIVIDQNKEIAAIKEFVEISKLVSVDGKAFLPTGSSWAVVNFISYGTGDTASWDARSRKGVVTDFIDSYGKMPTSDLDWVDIHNILNSNRPNQRNLKNEWKAIQIFKQIYLRLPDFVNVHDEWAVYYLSYKIRQPKRNLVSEAFAVRAFNKIFGGAPTSATEWAVVRTISYTGAKR